MAYNREVLRLAKERLADLAEVTANDGYHMPDTYDGDRPQQSKRYELLTQRYRRDRPTGACTLRTPHASFRCPTLRLTVSGVSAELILAHRFSHRIHGHPDLCYVSALMLHPCTYQTEDA